MLMHFYVGSFEEMYFLNVGVNGSNRLLAKFSDTTQRYWTLGLAYFALKMRSVMTEMIMRTLPKVEYQVIYSPPRPKTDRNSGCQLLR